MRSDWDIDPSYHNLQQTNSARSDWVINTSSPIAANTSSQAQTINSTRSSKELPATPPWRHRRPCLITTSQATMTSSAIIEANCHQPCRHGVADAPLQLAGMGRHHNNAFRKVNGARGRRRRLAGRSDTAFACTCPSRSRKQGALPLWCLARRVRRLHVCSGRLHQHAATTKPPPRPCTNGGTPAGRRRARTVAEPP